MGALDSQLGILIEFMLGLGLTVTITKRGESDFHAVAVHRKTGEQHVADGPTVFIAIARLADKCGIDLEDG